MLSEPFFLPKNVFLSSSKQSVAIKKSQNNVVGGLSPLNFPLKKKKGYFFFFQKNLLLDARSKEKLSSWSAGIIVSPSTIAATLFFCHTGIAGNTSHKVMVRLRYKLITCIPTKSSH